MVKDEYLLAGWAHFPVFLWVIGPLLILLLVRDDYARHQAKQAFIWQLVWVIVVSAILLVSYIAISFNQLWSLIFQFLAYLSATIAMSYAIYGAYKTFEGEEFSYPIIHYHIRR